MCANKDPLVLTADVNSRFNANGIIGQNLFDFRWFHPMRGDVFLVVLVPVIPSTRRHVNTLYRHRGNDDFFMNSPLRRANLDLERTRD